MATCFWTITSWHSAPWLLAFCSDEWAVPCIVVVRYLISHPTNALVSTPFCIEIFIQSNSISDNYPDETPPNLHDLSNFIICETTVTTPSIITPEKIPRRSHNPLGTSGFLKSSVYGFFLLDKQWIDKRITYYIVTFPSSTYTFVVDIDECFSNPCSNGQCVNGVNGYTCSCDAGWTGTNCDEGKVYLILLDNE